ncbi:hypothetical protein L207DRAFT_345830 [Hyaloscypha variabilis F]|uniref:Uncharacterized protein n=1 Tax=Hyaloscypha variabilis (strain UAMH 11265 / GT02V1 / F) TaxID=1149755 RepID=A0A2J6RQK9_HYAVF|nr:hypothetical protein L207DRAFT_345830 [Hyaloscypha variabilis F]
MPPIRHQDHHWTNFELHTMLCLLTKGVHLEGYDKIKKSEDTNTAKRNAYLTFATTLNNALHGTDYEQDIHKKEVTRKLDELLLNHKAIVGKGGLAERQFGGRVTRTLRLAWQRSLGESEKDEDGNYTLGVARPLDFDGSISEWNQWRRKEVENKRRAKMGLPPIDEVVVEKPEQAWWTEQAEQPEKAIQPRGSSAGQKQKPPGRNKWRSQQKNALTEEYVVDEADQGKIPTMSSDKIIQTKLDSFRTLPANVRSSDKFQWANPGARQQEFLGGLRGAAAIAAFQNAGLPSQGSGGYQGTSRAPSRYEPYVPPNNPRYSGSGRQPSSDMFAHGQGSSKSVPGLTREYSSSEDVETAVNTPMEANITHPHLPSSSFMPPVGFNEGYADAPELAASKEVGAVLATSIEGLAEGCEVEMGGFEEGEIWADLEAARGS